MTSENPSPTSPTEMKRPPRLDWRLLAILLVVMILPFLLFAGRIETTVKYWVEKPLSPAAVWALVTGVLWADILLPTPSSIVSTFAGARLGWFQGFLASNAGMTLGAVTAFAVGRLAAAAGKSRLSQEELALGAAGVRRWGPWAIVISRGIPLVAEVVLLYTAAKRISFWPFFWSALLANSAISLGYAILGQWAADQEWLGVVLGASGVFPLLLGITVRRRLLAPPPQEETN